MTRPSATRLSGRDGAAVEEMVLTAILGAAWVAFLVVDGARWYVTVFFAIATIACLLGIACSITAVEQQGDALVLHRANRLRPVRMVLEPGQNVSFEPTPEDGGRCGGTAVYIDGRLVTVITVGRDGRLVRGRIDCSHVDVA